MKNRNKFLALALAATAFTACEDLDTKYYGAYVTPEDKLEIVSQNPNMGTAATNAIFASAYPRMSVYSNHFDFGYPAIMLGLDLQGNDMVCYSGGYNWHAFWEAFSSPSPSGYPTSMAWYHLYDMIFPCNSVLGSITAEAATTDANKFYRANALAYRAFCYLNLVQLYQFNYVGHENSPAVPIITAENQDEYAQNGGPRATVQQVYDQILADLNEAVTLFNGSNYTRNAAMSSKPKRMLDASVAYGLLARTYLAMHKYADAATAAQNAISHSSCTPASMSAVSQPYFNSLDESNWMWGIAVAETDAVVTSAIVNWPSFVCSFADGYVSVGAWKYASSSLYNAIPVSDVRKGWFLDDNLKSENISSAQQAYLDQFDDIEPYTNVKFDSYNSALGTSLNANDIPLMRIEEMYYILAEGKVMSGDVAGGKAVFENLVKTYRNPSFVCQATTAEAVQEAIYQDRRIEFWGEGLSWFDLMRLGKNVERIGANWPSSYAFNVNANDPEQSKVMIYCIPTGEINGNKQISESDNNPSGTKPTPGQQ
jgi:hypothetical protein